MLAATQRPTQKAMGKGAVRSQMDVRISFRVRERKDVDLILGQGMPNAGWQAHTLNAPGKFLLSAPEHDSPRRARAFLLSDEAVADTAARHAQDRPKLDEISRQAPEEAEALVPASESHSASVNDAPALEQSEPEGGSQAALSAILTRAPDEGIPVAHLVEATDMSRRWVYYQLTALAKTGRAVQVSRGRWRAVGAEDHST